MNVVDKWLENLQNSTKESKQKVENEKIQSGEYFLSYRLCGVKSYERGKLSFYKSKILKNGFIGKGTKLDGYKVVNSYSYPELKNEEDENILVMASALYSHYRFNYSEDSLSGTLGYMLAKEVLLTNRCYFDCNKLPLQFQA